jgi:hypothetical protein
VQVDLATALMVAAGYLVIKTAIGNVIEPRIMGKGLGISTLAVFIALLFRGLSFGTVGMFLAVPLTTALIIALDASPHTGPLAILMRPASSLCRLKLSRQSRVVPHDTGLQRSGRRLCPIRSARLGRPSAQRTATTGTIASESIALGKKRSAYPLYLLGSCIHNYGDIRERRAAFKLGATYQKPPYAMDRTSGTQPCRGADERRRGDL